MSENALTFVKNSTDTLPALYETAFGAALLGDSLKVMAQLPDSSVNLVMTSPPYALHFKKEYGNADQADYVEWFLPFAQQIKRLLTDDGSFVLNIGGAWTQGAPTRSLYQFDLLLQLVRKVGFALAQEFFWYNPAKLPAPAEWVTVRRIRVKDSVEYLWWFGKTSLPKASNKKVLTEYSPDMKRLLKRGYKAKKRPSGHQITNKFTDQGGAIPSNLIEMGNNDSSGYYIRRCEESGVKPHPARYPIQLPQFFIKFLTDENDLVLDPFAGSNTTGAAAEGINRKWIAIEANRDYLAASRFRFEEGADKRGESQLILLDNAVPPPKTTKAMFNAG